MVVSLCYHLFPSSYPRARWQDGWIESENIQPSSLWKLSSHSFLMTTAYALMTMFWVIATMNIADISPNHTTGGGVFFLSRCTFWQREREILPILTNLGYFGANYALFSVLFTSLNNVAMYQNGQISGMTMESFIKEKLLAWHQKG